MNPKVFICGKIYNLATTTIKQIESYVQRRIDNALETEYSSERLVTFSLITDPDFKKVELHFKRGNWLGVYGHNPDFVNDSDAKLVCGLLDGSFKLPIMWQLIEPIAPGRYNLPLFELVSCYSDSSDYLGADKLKGMSIDSSEDEFVLGLQF